jgi:hypothetical protein
VLADAESFVCKLYDPNSQDNSIQDVRCDLFLGLTKTIENLPPTRDSLILYIRRAHYQALVWNRALENYICLHLRIVDGNWRKKKVLRYLSRN